MDLPQLVGLQCAFCQKSVGSVADGGFCPVCGNPVHIWCRQPGETIADGKCTACGGDPANSVAVEVRTTRERLEKFEGYGTVKFGERAPLACPECGSMDGFRTYRPEDSRSNAVPFVASLFFGLLGILAAAGLTAATAGQVQCVRCDFVFWPPNRLRDIGCIVATLVVGATGITLLLLWGR
jgi:hypothetical protein